jgi:hypothetical protein
MFCDILAAGSMNILIIWEKNVFNLFTASFTILWKGEKLLVKKEVVWKLSDHINYTVRSNNSIITKTVLIQQLRPEERNILVTTG